MMFDFTDHPDFDVEFAKIVAREIANLEYPNSEVNDVSSENKLCVDEFGNLNNVTYVTVVVNPKTKIEEISITLKIPNKDNKWIVD